MRRKTALTPIMGTERYLTMGTSWSRAEARVELWIETSPSPERIMSWAFHGDHVPMAPQSIVKLLRRLVGDQLPKPKKESSAC